MGQRVRLPKRKRQMLSALFGSICRVWCVMQSWRGLCASERDLTGLLCGLSE